MRRTLERAIAETPRPRIRAIGVGSGPGDVAEDVDRHLDEITKQHGPLGRCGTERVVIPDSRP